MFRGPTWIQVGFGEQCRPKPARWTAACAPQRLRPTRPPLQQNASAERDGYNSRGDFANPTVFPDDHGQATLPKFDPLLASGATMGLRCNSCPFRHILFGNWFQSVRRCLHLFSKNFRKSIRPCVDEFAGALPAVWSCPTTPSVGSRSVIVEQVLNASSEPLPDVVDRNIVTAFDHSLADATDGFAHIRNPDEMQARSRSHVVSPSSRSFTVCSPAQS